MNLDYVFLYSGYQRGEIKKISAVRTDRKGKGLFAYTTGIAAKKDVSSEFQPIAAAVADMCDVLKLSDSPVVIVSFNIERDKKTFSKAFSFNDCIWLDIYQLAWPLVVHTSISKERTFKELCQQFDVKIEGHECVMLCQLYFAMMARYKTSLVGEEILRDAGGNVLKTVRGFFGV